MRVCAGEPGSWISDFGTIDAHSQLRYADDYGAMVVEATFRFVNRGGRIEYSLAD